MIFFADAGVFAYICAGGFMPNSEMYAQRLCKIGSLFSYSLMFAAFEQAICGFALFRIDELGMEYFRKEPLLFLEATTPDLRK